MALIGCDSGGRVAPEIFIPVGDCEYRLRDTRFPTLTLTAILAAHGYRGRQFRAAVGEKDK